MKNSRPFQLFMIIMIAVLLHTDPASAQTTNSLPLTGLKVQVDSLMKAFDIEFQAQGEVSNLLIRISNAGGETVFLDNQYWFTGNYKQTIKMLDQEVGLYTIEIVKDDDLPLSWKLELK